MFHVILYNLFLRNMIRVFHILIRILVLLEGDKIFMYEISEGG